MAAVPLFFLSRWQTYTWARYGPQYLPSRFSAVTVSQITQTSAQISIVPGPGGQWKVIYGPRSGEYDSATRWVPATAGIGSAVTMVDLRPNTPYFFNVVLDGYLPNPAGLPISGCWYADEQSFSTLAPAPPTVPPNLVAPQSADGSAGGGEVDFQIGTDVPCTGFIDYGPTTAYGTSTAFTGGDGTSGGGRLALSVLGLTPGNTYHWRARVTGKSPPNNVQTTGPDHTVVPS